MSCFLFQIIEEVRRVLKIEEYDHPEEFKNKCVERFEKEVDNLIYFGVAKQRIGHSSKPSKGIVKQIYNVLSLRYLLQQHMLSNMCKVANKYHRQSPCILKGNYVACSGERVSNLNVNMNNFHFYIVAKAIHLMNNIQYIFVGSKAKQGKKAGCDLVYTIKVGNHIQILKILLELAVNQHYWNTYQVNPLKRN